MAGQQPAGLVDGRCNTCTGLTYFSLARSEAKKPSVCFGILKQLPVPPHPFKLPEDIENISKSLMLDEDGEAKVPKYVIFLGTTIVTQKMQSECLVPVCISGVATVIHSEVDSISPFPDVANVSQVKIDEYFSKRTEQGDSLFFL